MSRRVVGVAALFVCASCGVSADGQLEQVDSADLFGLDETTTTTPFWTPSA